MVQTTLGIDGMQCEMCEAHVNEAIKRAFPQIKRVSSTRRRRTTTILSEAVIDETALRSVIEKTGYEMFSFRSEPYVPSGWRQKLASMFS